MIDWEGLLDAVGVPYATRGKSVREGHIAVKCPFCPDDPSTHMTIRLEDGLWGCWRDRSHTGRNPVRLLRALTGLTWGECKELVREYTLFEIDTERVEDVKKRIAEHVRFAPGSLRLPDSFTPLWVERDGSPFLNWLRWRGFDDPRMVARTYSLLCCRSGVWADSVIFPITVFGVLKCWQARYIFDGRCRYRALSPNRETEGFVAEAPTSDLLWPFDASLIGGKRLYIVEGVMDALKVSWYGAANGVRAVCTFGCSGVSDMQTKLLMILAERYERVRIMYDADSFHKAVKVAEALSFLRVEPVNVSDFTEADDPGGMSPEDVARL